MSSIISPEELKAIILAAGGGGAGAAAAAGGGGAAAAAGAAAAVLDGGVGWPADLATAAPLRLLLLLLGLLPPGPVREARDLVLIR